MWGHATADLHMGPESILKLSFSHFVSSSHILLYLFLSKQMSDCSFYCFRGGVLFAGQEELYPPRILAFYLKKKPTST